MGADPAVTRLRGSGEKALKAYRFHDAKSALNSRFPPGGSSNGRTADSDSASGGSSPSPPAKLHLSPKMAFEAPRLVRHSHLYPHVNQTVDEIPTRSSNILIMGL